MNYYTSRYNVQTQLEGYPEVRLCGDSGRWICCQFKESMGRNGYSYTLVDNYGSSHLLYVNRIDNRLDLKSTTLAIDHFSVQLPSFSLMKYPFPDFLIDVLQTISMPLAFETLGRVAERFAKLHGKDRDGCRIPTGEF